MRAERARLDQYHVHQFAYITRKMLSVKEGNQTLLDNTMFLFGSGLSSGKDHVYTNLPLVIAGSAGGAIKTNHHFKSEQGTPVANLWLAMTQIMGAEIESLGDSTNALDLS